MSMSPMVQKEAVAGATANRGPVQQRPNPASREGFPSASPRSGNVQALHAPATPGAEHILSLQRMLGNRAVQRMFTGAVQRRPMEEEEAPIQQEAARGVQTTATRLPPVVQRTRYQVRYNAQNSRHLPHPKFPFDLDTRSSLSVADYNFVEEHRWTAEGLKQNATEEQMGEGKGPTRSLNYLGRNIRVRYDMKKNKHGTAVYPRAHVMGKDIRTQEMWELGDHFTGSDLDLFLKGVRGEVDVNPDEMDTSDELNDPTTAGIQVRALLLSSDTLDFSTEDYTAKLLSRVTDVSSYKRLFRGDTWEPSYGAAVSQNTNTSLENATDRINVYNTFGEFIWGRREMRNDILTNFPLELDDSTKSHIPLFRKLKVMLSMVPDLFTITGDGNAISAATFIQIANEVILRARMEQEQQFRTEERSRDILSDDEDDQLLDERLQAVSPETIQERLDHFRRVQKSLSRKIDQYEEILKRKNEKK